MVRKFWSAIFNFSGVHCENFVFFANDGYKKNTSDGIDFEIHEYLIPAFSSLKMRNQLLLL